MKVSELEFDGLGGVKVVLEGDVGERVDGRRQRYDYTGNAGAPATPEAMKAMDRVLKAHADGKGTLLAGVVAPEGPNDPIRVKVLKVILRP